MLETFFPLPPNSPLSIHTFTTTHFSLCVRRRYACMSAVCPLSKITVFVCCLYMVQQGEIWPNITAQFVIVFKPEEAKLYQQTIYCDVTGQCQYKTIPHTSPTSHILCYWCGTKEVNVRLRLSDCNIAMMSEVAFYGHNEFFWPITLALALLYTPYIYSNRNFSYSTVCYMAYLPVS